jgi:Tfp pilus assembly protein PilN
MSDEMINRGPFGINLLLQRFRGGKDAATDAAGLDFLPAGYADRRARRRADVVLLGLFAIVVGVIGVTWHLGERALAQAEEQFAAVDAEYAEAARRIEQVRAMKDRQKSVADRMELTASLLERMPRSNLLAELTNHLPGGVTLQKAELESRRRATPPPPPRKPGQPAPPPPPPTPLAYDTKLSIEGEATTEGQVSDYIDALTRGGYFRRVDLRWVRRGRDAGNTGDEPSRMFMIALELDASAEPRDEAEAATTLADLSQETLP